MLFWICPDCGRECSPKIRECPACTKTEGVAAVVNHTVEAATVTDGILAMAETIQATRQSAEAPVLQIAASSANGASANGHSQQLTITDTATATEEESRLPAVEVPSGETIDLLVRPLVESAAPAAAPEPEAAEQLTLQLPLQEAAAVVEPVTETVEPIADGEQSPAIESAIEQDPVEAPIVEAATPAAAEPPAEEPVAQVAATESEISTVEQADRPVVQEPLVETARVSTEPSAVPHAAIELAPTEAPIDEPPVLVVADAPIEEPVVEPVETAAVETTAAAAALEQLSAELVDEPRVSTIAETSTPTVQKVAVEHQAETQAPVEESAGPVEAAIEQLAREQLVAAETTAAPVPETEQAVVAETVDPGIAELEQLPRALELQAETILDSITQQLQIRESGIRAIVATFQVAPTASLLPPALDVVAAPAPPDEVWKHTPRPTIPASKPLHPSAAVPIFGPQALTLAGPALPLQLRTLIEERSSTETRPVKRASLPSWIVSLVVATCMFLGAGSVLQFLTGSREPKAAAAQTTQSVAAPIASAAVEQHPFSRFIEVTGIRVVADLSKKSQVQYIVVNHSSLAINNASVHLAVRSASESIGAAPLFTVSSVVSLGPFQSKEIRTDLDSQLRSTAIPEWDSLRPDVQVSIQQ